MIQSIIMQRVVDGRSVVLPPDHTKVLPMLLVLVDWSRQLAFANDGIAWIIPYSACSDTSIRKIWIFLPSQGHCKVPGDTRFPRALASLVTQNSHNWMEQRGFLWSWASPASQNGNKSVTKGSNYWVLLPLGLGWEGWITLSSTACRSATSLQPVSNCLLRVGCTFPLLRLFLLENLLWMALWRLQLHFSGILHKTCAETTGISCTHKL